MRNLEKTRHLAVIDAIAERITDGWDPAIGSEQQADYRDGGEGPGSYSRACEVITSALLDQARARVAELDADPDRWRAE